MAQNIYRRDSRSNLLEITPSRKEIVTIEDTTKHGLMSYGQLRTIAQLLERDNGIEVRDWDTNFGKGVLGQNSFDVSTSAVKFGTGALGAYSVAMGADTTASGIGSLATGKSTTASGINSVAMGENSIASGQNSMSFGFGSLASGDYSVALGKNSIASGRNSLTVGENAIASADASIAFSGGDADVVGALEKTGIVPFITPVGEGLAYSPGKYEDRENGLVYFSGGYDSNLPDRVSTGFFSISMIDGTMTELTPSPVPLYSSDIEKLDNGNLLVVGGSSYNDNVGFSCFEYNIAGNSWTQKNDLPFSHAKGVIYKRPSTGNIVVFGGVDETFDIPDAVAGRVHEYDEVSDTWSVGNFPLPNGETVGGVGYSTMPNGGLVLVGGFWTNNWDEPDRICFYDDGTNSWDIQTIPTDVLDSGNFSPVDITYIGDSLFCIKDSEPWISYLDGQGEYGVVEFTYDTGSSPIIYPNHTGGFSVLRGSTNNPIDTIMTFGVASKINIASGVSSLAHGSGAIASGSSSTAEGQGTEASGSSSHAEGKDTQASGQASHAEGSATQSIGLASHTEGKNTLAYGDAAHAEGNETISMGTTSHAEGSLNKAFGSYSHAEGFDSEARYKASNPDIVLFDHTTGKLQYDTGSASGGLSSTLYPKIYVKDGSDIVERGLKLTNRVGSLPNPTYDFVINDGLPWSGTEELAYDVLFINDSDSSVVHAEGYQTKSYGGSGSHSEGKGSTASGESSHAEGHNTTASGQTSHAEGYATQAIGETSHAEGYSTYARGTRSHSEGYSTNANGQYSHAEGRNTTATGTYSHVEGYNNSANGQSAHCEGETNTAHGSRAHAEGYSNNASGSYSHAEGYDTDATSTGAHAEGYQTNATGNYGSHSEGRSTNATNYGSHAEGYNSQASGQYSHAEGYSTYANGTYSHAEGNDTNATNTGSHSEGQSSTASGQASHAEGYSTLAQGSYSHAEGNDTNATNTGAHSEGQQTTAAGSASHAEGYASHAGGSYSHAEGQNGNAAGQSSHAEGYSANASQAYAHAEGYNTNATGTNGSHSQGYNTTASGNYGAHAEGYSTTASGVNGSHAEGHNTTASGQTSHAEGYQTTASGNFGAHAEGYNTTASGSASHSEGQNTTAEGQYSHAGGYDSQAEGHTSFAHGDRVKSVGGYSAAFGRKTSANYDYQFVAGYHNVGTSQATLMEIGNGDWSNSSNAFEINFDGAIIAPNLNNIMIDNYDNSILINKGFFEGLDASESIVPGTPTIITEPNNTVNESTGFGYAHDSNDDILVIANPYWWKDNSIRVGRAYIYDRTDYSLITEIANPSSVNYSNLGGDGAVCISGSRLFLGDGGSDVVNVYDLAGNYLSNIIGVDNSYFGSFAAVSDSYLAVGAQNESVGGSSVGAIHLYNLSDLTFAKTLLPVGATGGEYLGGMSFTLNDSYLITALNDGQIICFDVPSGTERFRTVVTDSDIDGYAPYPLAPILEVDRFLISGSWNNTGVMVMDYDGNIIHQITEYNGSYGGDANFGGSLTSDDDYYYVGANGNGDGAKRGEIHFYDKVTFEFLGMYEQPEMNYSFTRSMSYSNGELLVGSPGDGLTDSGTFNVFKTNELTIEQRPGIPLFIREDGSVDMRADYEESTPESVATKAYVDLRSQALETVPALDVTFDLERNINFTIDVDQDINLKRPLNMVAGQSGFIILKNATLDTAFNVNFDYYWFNAIGGLFGSTTVLGDRFAVRSIRYEVLDENTLFIDDSSSETTPHLPVYINGAMDTLAINAEGDYLLM